MLDAEDGREVVRAFRAEDGEVLWSADLDAVFGDQQGPEGPRNTAVVDAERVYAVSCRGELKCLSLDDGKLLWRVNFVDDLGAEFIGEKGKAEGAVRHGNDGSPLVDGPHLIVSAGGANGHSVVCFDKLNGKVIWHAQNDVAGYGSPVVADIAGVKQVVVFTAEGTIGLRRDNGELLWRVPMETAFGRHVMNPVIHDDVVVVGSHTAGLTGIKITRTGDAFSAENAWVNKDAAPNFSHPVANGRFLFGLGPDKQVVCVDMETGELHWSHSGNIITSASKAYSGFINAQGNILQLTDAGELILFRASPGQYEQLGRVQVAGVNWCSPALSDGVLYLRDGTRKAGSLYAIRLREE